MKKYILNTLKFLAFLSIGILLLWFAFRGVNFEKFLDSFKDINYWWVALSLVLAWFGFVIRAWRWKLLIEPLGYNVKLSDAYHAVSIAYMANFAFPRIGEVTRCAVLNRSDKVPFDALIGTVITERVSDLIMLVIIIIGVFFAKMDFFGKFLTENIFNPILAKLSHAFTSLWIFGLIATLIFAALIILVFVFKHKIKQIAMVRKISSIAKGVLNGVLTAFRMKKKIQFLILSIILWLGCYWFMTWVPTMAMPATSQLDPMDGLFLLVVGGLAITAPVQGGIGIFHAMITLALTSLYAINYEHALAFAFLIHESSSIFYILLGALSFLILSLKRRKLNKVSVS